MVSSTTAKEIIATNTAATTTTINTIYHPRSGVWKLQYSQWIMHACG